MFPIVSGGEGRSKQMFRSGSCGRRQLAAALKNLGTDRPIMGNLDPVTLLAPWRELHFHVDDVLNRAGGRPGHIFNLGHGILPETPVDNVRRLVDYVHERTAIREVVSV